VITVEYVVSAAVAWVTLGLGIAVTGLGDEAGGLRLAASWASSPG
jgi:hypothetical protein